MSFLGTAPRKCQPQISLKLLSKVFEASCLLYVEDVCHYPVVKFSPAFTFQAIPASLGVSATKKYHVNSLAVARKAKEAIGGITKLTHSDGIYSVAKGKKFS